MSVKLKNKPEQNVKKYEDIKNNVYTIDITLEEALAVRVLLGTMTNANKEKGITTSSVINQDIKNRLTFAIEHENALNVYEWKELVNQISEIEEVKLTK